MKLEIVSMIKINGTWYQQEEIPRDEIRKLIEMKVDDTMRIIGFERRKTA